MLWILAFHIVFMVAWFAGLFYLPRLFMYHALSADQPSLSRFKVMERKLFWMIMTPAGVLSSVFGVWLLLLDWQFYFQQKWMLAKLMLVFCLWIYHFFCGYLLQLFKINKNPFSAKFYRFFNEIPTFLLMAIVILVVVKP
ncbi:MAG: TIGR00701 family protein [Gammaproteobacteria bacterium CG_4_10_14_0_8_um_filter_38_16]|nr:MAG: TIGR00701 family protein [Gammaproteobacteria bacterium CG_4_10_14_0_8_um_filter_38_16]PJA03866.1 MAG: TIGR00701 family protein [Gammaproteobacteria bacterium CG_4_10_14_0_2_um_filter_38_22]PJB10838.1 MAG: TIGR00701 family protein [Gammaproteobacteria bacterium CG_4_9_14_3_um_filter_38_9]